MTQREIDSFHHFATDKLGINESDELSLDHIFDLWRIENPSSSELAESLDSLSRGLADIESGRVFAARAVIEELREKVDLRQRS